MSANQAVNFSGYEKENQTIRRRDVPKVPVNEPVTDVDLKDDKKKRTKRVGHLILFIEIIFKNHR